MEITFIANKSKSYELDIRYYYYVGNELNSRRFMSLSNFEGFMKECHPETPIVNLVERFNLELSTLIEKSHELEYDKSCAYVCLHCGICGEELFVFSHDIGIIEKMHRYKVEKEAANDGYIMTYLCHNWKFDMDGGIMGIKYWYDPSNESLPVYKIHAFKDKVLLDFNVKDNNKTLICSNNYYIHCNGKKKE